MAQTDTCGAQILIIADPGLTSRRVSRIEASLGNRLGEIFGPETTVSTTTEQVPLSPDNLLAPDRARALAQAHHRPDVLVLLTEMPRHTQGRPLVAEVIPEQGVVVIACPTLGLTWTGDRLLRTIVSACERLHSLRAGPAGPGEGSGRDRWVTGEDGRSCSYAPRGIGAARTVLGMVAANEPLKTAPKLSGAMAAAGAAGAFGVFYSSIWQMSAALSTQRLAGIGVLAMTLMVVWLIVSNGLWDAPANERVGKVVFLYNLSTVATLFLCTLLLYLTLFIVILFAGLVVIDAGFMESIMGESVSIGNYVSLAWLSAAMGVVAGGLGSGFDSQTDLRQVTHGQRERQRVLTENDQDDDDVLDGPS